MDTSPWRTWLSAGVLSPSAASYRAYLQRHGYSCSSTAAYLHAVGHFAHWLTDARLTVRHLDESVVRRFLTAHLPTVAVQLGVNARSPPFRPRSDICCTSYVPTVGYGTPRRAVARDSGRIGTLHQPFGARVRTGRQDPRQQAMVGGAVLGGSVRSRTDCHPPTHAHRHRGLPGATRDALHARQRRRPRLRAAQLPAFPRRPVRRSRGAA